MTIIDIVARGETVDKDGTVHYTTDVNPGRPGFLIFAESAVNKDMLIANQFYDGTKPLVVLMRPWRTPARKFVVGDVVCKLVLI